MRLPKHVALDLSHNPHALEYVSVRQYIERHEDRGPDWVSDAEREAAIAANEMWEVRWYPDTPVGFVSYAAHDLQALLEHVRDR